MWFDVLTLFSTVYGTVSIFYYYVVLTLQFYHKSKHSFLANFCQLSNGRVYKLKKLFDMLKNTRYFLNKS